MSFLVLGLYHLISQLEIMLDRESDGTPGRHDTVCEIVSIYLHVNVDTLFSCFPWHFMNVIFVEVDS